MVRIFVASRRPWAAEALATSSYGTNFDQPLSAETFVSAAVNVVLPWSTWPIVPTFTCGLLRSNFAFAMNSPGFRCLVSGIGVADTRRLAPHTAVNSPRARDRD